MEKIVIEIEKGLWENLVRKYKTMFLYDLKVNEDYTIKEVKIEDDFFKDDATHKELKSQSNKAYKTLKKYEFDKRNG